ncbi:hypothetical protein ACHQM5_012047 [Ranunculus cassubicifolius]
MGEEAKQEEVKVETKVEEKPEEKKEEPPKVEDEKKEDLPKVEEEKKEEPPKPPAPVILSVNLHCAGCAKKIEKSLMRHRGVEAVTFDMGQNQITIKGVVDPQALCNRIQKKTRKRATIISPLPATEGEPIPQLVTSQVSGLITVELNVNMHCEACAEQLKRKILKMRGVQTAETDSVTSKVTVTGTMDAQRLVDYVYSRTKKQARIVPQPEPEPEKAEEKTEEGEKPVEEPPKAEENVEKKEEEKPPEEEKKGEENGEKKEEKVEEGKEESSVKVEQINHFEDRNNAHMMHYYPYAYAYAYPPMYVTERILAPQIFSDENPNACCIS